MWKFSQRPYGLVLTGEAVTKAFRRVRQVSILLQCRLKEPGSVLEVQPWMADQEIHFPAVTYWEGGVRFEGVCNGARGNGYAELTGYAGNLPLP